MTEKINISKYLPHRYPFLFVDKVKEIVNNKKILATKLVSHNEQIFQGHFPGHPVFPGVLMVESLAQAACILMTSSSLEPVEKLNTYLTGIENAKFSRLVQPGDALDLIVEVEKEISRAGTTFFKFKGVAMVGDEIACQANFSAAAVTKKD